VCGSEGCGQLEIMRKEKSRNKHNKRNASILEDNGSTCVENNSRNDQKCDNVKGVVGKWDDAKMR